MLFPRELEVLNIIAKSKEPLTCADVAARGKGLTVSTVHTITRKLGAEGLVSVSGTVQRRNVQARLFVITKKAKEVVLDQLVEQVYELNGLVAATDVMAELVNRTD